MLPFHHKVVQTIFHIVPVNLATENKKNFISKQTFSLRRLCLQRTTKQTRKILKQGHTADSQY